MRFLSLFVLAVVGIGLLLHSDLDIPHTAWVGHLAGDLVIRKNGSIFYFPLTTALIVSVLLSFLLGRKK